MGERARGSEKGRQKRKRDREREREREREGKRKKGRKVERDRKTLRVLVKTNQSWHEIKSPAGSALSAHYCFASLCSETPFEVLHLTAI